MLELSKKDGTPIAKFENYYELYEHLRDMENAKLFEGHPEFGKTAWSFIVLLPESVAQLSRYLVRRHDPETIARALHEGSGLIEICDGNESEPRLIVASPEVDVEGFRKEFCEDYCDAHGMHIEELEEGR